MFIVPIVCISKSFIVLFALMVTKRELQFIPFNSQIEYINDVKVSNMKYSNFGQHYPQSQPQNQPHHQPYRYNPIVTDTYGGHSSHQPEEPQIFALPRSNPIQRSHEQLLHQLHSLTNQGQPFTHSQLDSISFGNLFPNNNRDWSNKSIWNKGNNIW